MNSRIESRKVYLSVSGALVCCACVLRLSGEIRQLQAGHGSLGGACLAHFLDHQHK